VRGEQSNLKITTPQDIRVASMLIR
jgi:2-C-methyl-D-erythritol 4-phosphate cytidylyltransferase